MRLVPAILILGMVSVAAADVTVSNGMMSAEINSQSLQTVIQAVSSQTQVTFSVDDSVRTSPVTASFQNLPIALGIKKMLEGTGINYVVMGGASGQPESIYIGSSERPGAPGQKLDSRPTNNRSVTQPVYRPQQQPQPQPQLQQQPDPNRGNNQNPNEGRSVPPGMQKKMNGGGAAPAQNATPTLPPTGGGLGTQTPQPQQPVQPEVKPAQQKQNSNSNDDEDDDSDDEE